MLLQDLKYSFRRLVRTPAFTLTAVLTLALGIGTNTAIFSTVNALLIRPYPFPNLNRLMLLREAEPNRAGENNSATADYLDFRAQSTTFSDIAAFRYGSFSLSNEPGAAAVGGYMVTANLFQMVGAQPMLGRNLLGDDEQEGRNAVAVLSCNVWNEYFGSDKSVIGKTITLNGHNTTIVGVMPEDFHYPVGGKIWVPLTLTPTDRINRSSRTLTLLGALRDGVSPRQAETELQAISRQLQQRYPTTNLKRTATVLLLRKEQYSYTAPMFLLLQAAAGFVLLLACSNLVNLLLAQAVNRGREITVRCALGAKKLQLVRLFISENALLALMAGIVAVGISFISIKAIRNGMPPGMTEWIAGWDRIHLDANVLGFAILLATALALAIGAGSTYHFLRTNLSIKLKDDARTSTGSRAQHRTLSILVVTQVALSVVLLAGAASTIRSFFALSQLYKGFNPEDVFIAEIELPKQSYSDPIKIASFYDRALLEIQALPQIASAAFSSNTPASNVDNERVNFDIQGRKSLLPSEARSADLQIVSADFFSTFHVPLLQGRQFSASDGRTSPRVAIINQSMSKENWPSAAPLGQSLKLTGDNPDPVTVIGVVPDIKLNWSDPQPRATIYLPYTQFPRGSLTMVARTRQGRKDAGVAMRRLMKKIDPNVALSGIHPLTLEISDSLAPIRIIGWLLLVFGGVALALSTIGIYGMLSHRVARRTHEFGIRMALGATSDDLFHQIVREALMLAGIGLAIGLPLAYELNALAASQLFGLNGLNWMMLAAFTVGILSFAVLAALMPARRAMRADPMVALRYE